MTTELWTLFWATILCLVLPLFYAGLYSKQVGVKGLLGNREDVPGPTGLAGRGLRAHHNLLENLAPYAAIILIARFLNLSNEVTVIAAYVFLAARLVHTVAYLIGIPGIRTLAYNVGLFATLAIAWEIFTHH